MSGNNIVKIALVTAMICAGAFAAVPLPFSPAPVTLQTCVIFFAALYMPKKDCLISVFLYVLIGAAGLPVFSGGGAGAAALVGRTGGFIVGFLPMAFCISSVNAAMRKSANLFLSAAAAVTAGNIILYGFGAAWFSFLTGTGALASIAVCALPFIPGDAVKAAAAISAYAAVRKIRI